MGDARVGNRNVTASPESADLARCPDCGAEVQKRSRRTMDKTTTWFYRHKQGSGKGCPRRYVFGS